MKLALICALFVAISTVAQAQLHCAVAVSKRISIKAPAVFSGTLVDDKNIPFAKKTMVLTSLDLDKDQKPPKVSQSAVTDSQGAFHFDSVPAGKYAIAIDFVDWAVKKAEVHCATPGTCRVALVVKSVTPTDCDRPHYFDDQPSGLRH